MEVPIRIISREIIKPSSPTPNHLRIHKFSRIDQINLDFVYPSIFFYNSGTHENSSHHLKQSLSKILTHYYPFAGRVKDHLSVECDDYGVSFIEAHIETNISDSLLLEQLMPYKPHEMITTTQFNLAVQVSYFGCGGVGICVCFRHCIADAVTAANFIKSWSAVASFGGNNTDAIEKDVVLDFSSIFPPEDGSALSPTINSEELLKSSSTDTVVKRFVFDGSKIAALREIIGNRPTRFEAVFSLMWKAVTSARTEGDQFVASFPVNLRRKMNPPISDQCMGNLFAALMANWPLEETVNYKDFVAKLRELSSLLNDDYAKKAFPNGWTLRHMKNDVGRDDTKSGRRRIFHISSCCGLPFYETDFGWGKPNWVTILQAHNAGDSIFVTLLDTCDGKGVEALVAMSKEEMAKFEQDSQVIAYASVHQIA